MVIGPACTARDRRAFLLEEMARRLPWVVVVFDAAGVPRG